jgi:hypothetical protein
MKILDSARKHYQRDGITDEDVEFVVNHPLRRVYDFESQPDKILYLGLNHSLTVLEAITIEIADGEEIVIHAMKATKKHLEYLL